MSIKQFPGGIVTKNPTAPTTAAAKGIWTLAQAADFVKQGIWPRSPGAPTIGTATRGNASATVTYTAPTDLGTGTVTYTATSSPGGLTGTGASPITVSGLTNGTAYTFTVTASTPGGTGPASAASNSVTPVAPPAIGSVLGGGYFTGQIDQSGTIYNLVIGPVASAQSSLRWKTTPTSTSGTSSVIDGPSNSAAMNDASHPAAQFCEGLTVGGFSDWYMPAKNELEISYYNLKPKIQDNVTNSGANPNAVPSRGNYSTSNPAQTPLSDFKDTGTENFTPGVYWSSTQTAAGYAWVQGFNDGFQDPNGYKGNSNRVRAVRRILA
jgi:hypothetical protein